MRQDLRPSEDSLLIPKKNKSCTAPKTYTPLTPKHANRALTMDLAASAVKAFSTTYALAFVRQGLKELEPSLEVWKPMVIAGGIYSAALTAHHLTRGTAQKTSRGQSVHDVMGHMLKWILSSADNIALILNLVKNSITLEDLKKINLTSLTIGVASGSAVLTAVEEFIKYRQNNADRKGHNLDLPTRIAHIITETFIGTWSFSPLGETLKLQGVLTPKTRAIMPSVYATWGLFRGANATLEHFKPATGKKVRTIIFDTVDDTFNPMLFLFILALNVAAVKFADSDTIPNWFFYTVLTMFIAGEVTFAGFHIENHLQMPGPAVDNDEQLNVQKRSDELLAEAEIFTDPRRYDSNTESEESEESAEIPKSTTLAAIGLFKTYKHQHDPKIFPELSNTLACAL